MQINFNCTACTDSSQDTWHLHFCSLERFPRRAAFCLPGLPAGSTALRAQRLGSGCPAPRGHPTGNAGAPGPISL